MIIQKEITTDKQREKEDIKRTRKANRKIYLTNWHTKFVFYKCIYSHDTNTKTHVFFQTIERKIRYVRAPHGYSEWKFKKYRIMK